MSSFHPARAVLVRVCAAGAKAAAVLASAKKEAIFMVTIYTFPCQIWFAQAPNVGPSHRRMLEAAIATATRREITASWEDRVEAAIFSSSVPGPATRTSVTEKMGLL
jgi:hypothetical protein